MFSITNKLSNVKQLKNQDSLNLYNKSPNKLAYLNINTPGILKSANKQPQYQSKKLNQINNLQYDKTFCICPVTFSYTCNTHTINKCNFRIIDNEEAFIKKINKIADVSNINEFWEVFQFLQKPNQYPVGTDYHIFKQNIKPMWEDNFNKNGGKLSILLNINFGNLIWKETSLKFVKGYLPYYDFINGIVISVRPKYMVLSFWLRNAKYSMILRIKNTLSQLFNAKTTNYFKYTPFK